MKCDNHEMLEGTVVQLLGKHFYKYNFDQK